MLKLVLLAATLNAAPLPKPSGLTVHPGIPPVFQWQPVGGAALYRVAVFAEPDAEGKRPIMAAVWVKGSPYVYGSDEVVAKAGKLPSTKAKPLKPGAYKVWVAAARANGADKSDWSASDLSVAGSAPAESPLPTATFTSTPVPLSAGAEAAIEVDLAADFKETPEPDEEAKPSPTPVGTPTLEKGRAALEAGRYEDAVSVLSALVESDGTSADAWEALADAYDARKMKAEAKEAYEKALALDKKREKAKKWMEENVRR